MLKYELIASVLSRELRLGIGDADQGQKVDPTTWCVDGGGIAVGQSDHSQVRVESVVSWPPKGMRS